MSRNAASQWRSCRPSCQPARAVKKPCWQHVHRWQCSRQGPAARRPQVGLLKRNSHWLKCGSWQLFFKFFYLLGVHTSIGKDAAAVRLATWHQSHGNSCSFHSFRWRFCFSNGFNESMRVTLWWSPTYTTQGSTAWLSTLCSPSSSFLSSCFWCDCCSRGEKSCLAHIIPSLNNH